MTDLRLRQNTIAPSAQRDPKGVQQGRFYTRSLDLTREREDATHLARKLYSD
jgi:hypothetical protein